MRRFKSETKLDKYDTVLSLTRHRSFRVLVTIAVLYIILVTLEIPFVFNTQTANTASISLDTLTRHSPLKTSQDFHSRNAPSRPFDSVFDKNPTRSQLGSSQISNKPIGFLSTLRFDPETFDPTKKDGSVELHRTAKTSWEVGKKFWLDIELGRVSVLNEKVQAKPENRTESCPHSVTLTGSKFLKGGKVVEIPCGLTLGSHITVVGKPRGANVESEQKKALVKDGEEGVTVSQFIMELQGLKTVDGEDPPRILHFNPRLRGDWSGNPVIEMNTCYRMQWGRALRCEGWRSNPDDETVDGQVKCEEWIRDADHGLEESKASWWLNRLIGHTNKVTFDWPYPFAEEKLFVLTLSAGLEGYHVNVDGRHVTSFPYRTGFTLEDATGLTVNGDVDVHSVFAASLPATHPSFDPQRLLEMSPQWKAPTPTLPNSPLELFIGVLSAGNHFAERMSVRKSWMQHKFIKSSVVVARFFVALHARKEVNLELKKEAEYFGDIVLVPYMDNYDLVVLKTIAICEYGVRAAHANYIMKVDDDTFVRVDAILNEVQKVGVGKSLYIGNINYYHKPLRHGKWAVTYEEWPEEAYPPYANGPGYILSQDIARFIVLEFEGHKLRLFKMEDVSMGMWVEQFNRSKPVEYVHSLKYCQFGCIESYITAHYQSPRQMICLWENLQKLGKPECCNMR